MSERASERASEGARERGREGPCCNTFIMTTITTTHMSTNTTTFCFKFKTLDEPYKIQLYVHKLSHAYMSLSGVFLGHTSINQSKLAILSIHPSGK